MKNETKTNANSALPVFIASVLTEIGVGIPIAILAFKRGWYQGKHEAYTECLELVEQAYANSLKEIAKTKSK